MCPVVAIIQWRSEMERYVEPGSLKVMLYHGPKRTLDPAELAQVSSALVVGNDTAIC